VVLSKEDETAARGRFRNKAWLVAAFRRNGNGDLAQEGDLEGIHNANEVRRRGWSVTKLVQSGRVMSMSR
jgi:hypothetical protein